VVGREREKKKKRENKKKKKLVSCKNNAQQLELGLFTKFCL
jgi:hypothetical protein